MKKQIRYITLLAVAVIVAIVGYQGYWLTDIYHTLQRNLDRDIREAMRAADFEEIVHRVELLKNEQQGGQMDVRVGVDQERDKAVVANNYNEERPATTAPVPDELDNRLEFDEFANVLRTEEDVKNVGMQMQRGIHSGLDQLKAIDAAYYDSVVQQRIKKMGVMGTCIIQYIKYAREDSLQQHPIVLYSSKDLHTARVDTFRHWIDTEKREAYLLLRRQSIVILPQQMYSPILLSVLTLLVLIVALCYIIGMLKRMNQLDEMKSDFTNNITHEMKTPIAVAYAASDALLNFDAGRDPEKQKKYLTICMDQLNLLKELVERILSLSAERQLKVKLNLEEVEPYALVMGVVTNHQMKTEKKVTFKVNIPEKAHLTTDAFHFTNMVNNLIDNAIKYAGEEVTVQIGLTQSKGNTVLTIRDNGMGIARDQQKFVFDRFYRVPHGNRHDIKGYGLGLNYVKVMMERLGGSVSLQSELGKGSTFTLIFKDDERQN